MVWSKSWMFFSRKKYLSQLNKSAVHLLIILNPSLVTETEIYGLYFQVKKKLIRLWNSVLPEPI